MPKVGDTVAVDVVLSGGMRRAAAVVDGSTIDMTTNSDGDLEGSKTITLDRDPLHFVLVLYGANGAAFTSTLTLDPGQNESAIARKGLMKDDVAVRTYDIALSEFK
jgi:hypothetical protein